MRNENEERPWKLQKWLSERFSQLSKKRKEDAEIIDEQFDCLDDRISGLREWIEIVVDDAQEDLELSREQALEALSAELQEEIREPILNVLTDEDDGENLWANGISFAVVLAVIKILDERPDLVNHAVNALGGKSATGKAPLSSPTSGEGGQEGSNSGQKGGARSSD